MAISLKEHQFLLEIGVEEIPAEHSGPAAEYLRAGFDRLLNESNLSAIDTMVSHTPRRFFLLASGLPETQADIRVERTGPALKISYDAEGNLTPAALGFLKKNNATAADLCTQSTEKGEFIALSFVQKGRSTKDILRDWILEIVPKMPFPKRMIWNDPQLAFSRPLRWLCVLWDQDVIDLELGGLKSGRISFGNRRFGLDFAISIADPDTYTSVLAQVGVIADRAVRKQMLVGQLQQLLDGSTMKVIEDDRLAETVCDLVEYPHAVLAGFDAAFLKLPEKIITSTISQNQKYFGVLDASGKLSNRFVFISNGDPDHDDLIRKGNEKVVKARLSDAMWYFDEDCRHPLESYRPRLADVVFQSRLGTLAAKNLRVEKLSAFICQELGLNADDSADVLRTANLCKADLVTNMLGEKEFTKLQGYIGKQYALVSGEKETVAEGIYEHYMPRGSNDALPASLTGAIVAVADKTDTVCGIIGVGMTPTGSADPFALRRAANGVVQILMEREWQLNLPRLIDYAISLVADDAVMEPGSNDSVQNFFLQRVAWSLKQNGLEYDVIDSVTHLSMTTPADMQRRCAALQNIKSTDDFTRLVIGFKRASNIIGEDAELPVVDPTLFTDEAERDLYQALNHLSEQITRELAENSYDRVLGHLTSFGTHIDSFFDAVLVNCDDMSVRTNRHALLGEVKRQFLQVADIGRIVTDTENGE